MSNILLLGPPAAGKGTQAKKLSSWYHWPHISTVDIFRQAYQQQTALGVEAHDTYWGKGLLVPDEVTNKLAFERLNQDDCLQGFILDGYPRTIGQGLALEQYLDASQRALDRVLYFFCPDEILMTRATSRRTCQSCGEIYGGDSVPQQPGVCHCSSQLYQRADDREEVVRERLLEYQRKTAPLLNFYQTKGIVSPIDASSSIELVFTAAKGIVEKL